jgi:serine/threonine protein kinase
MEVGNSVGKINLAFRKEPKLSEVLEAKVPISFQGAKTIVYQLLCGLYHLHSRDVVHGSICLDNVTFGRDGKMKLCDWFLQDPPVDAPEIRMCSAPEKIFLGHKLDKLSDLWSCGVVFASVLLKRPLFDAPSLQGQIESMIQVLGCPNERDWPLFGNVAFKYKQFQNRYSNLEGMFPELSTTRQGFTFLERLLRYDQSKRTPAHRMVRQAFLTEEAPLPSSAALPEYVKIVEKLAGSRKEENDTNDEFYFV